MALKIRRGDKVIVISGTQKGSTSIVESVSGDRAVLKDVNPQKRHIKKTKDSPGKIEQIFGSIHLSNLAHVINNKPVKVCFQVSSEGKFLISKRDQKRIRKV